ncbi:MAG: hypothetical protein IJ439_07390 [Tyzzerella sp.]|nr:hypothetical protein [Tyzzerella sp.]
MNEKNLVICDEEFRYAERLSENISGRSELALKIYTCTDLEHVMELLNDREIHILIIDEVFTQEERAKIQAEQVFVLTKEACKDLRSGEKEVSKFQSSDQILAEIFETYFETTNQNILKSVKKSTCKMIAVYSPIHRIGKTTFAVALGKELARKEKTLYLNMEEYAGVEGQFMKAEGRNLGDLLYYMRQENGNTPLRLSTMVGKLGELDYIPPILISTDLKEIKLEEWKQLLETILENSAYENVVLDLGEGVQGLFHILQLCDRIYMPVLDNTISKRKLNQFEEELRCLQMQNLMQKTHQFTAVEDMETYARKITKEEKKE